MHTQKTELIKSNKAIQSDSKVELIVFDDLPAKNDEILQQPLLLMLL